MSLFAADKEKCTQCGACVLGCPRLIVGQDDQGYPFVFAHDESYCMGCGHCVINCEYGAASLGTFNAENAVDLHGVALPSAVQSRRLLLTRRSVRKFKPDPIDRGTIQAILDIARFAPSASNRQPVRWIAISGKTLAAFKDLYLQRIRENFTSPDRYSRQDDQQRMGLDPVFRAAPMLIIAAVPQNLEVKEDAAIAMTYLELAAHSLGLGTMWSGITMRLLRRDKKACALLGIDEDEWVGAVMALGHPVLPVPTRLPDKKQPDVCWLD